MKKNHKRLVALAAAILMTLSLACPAFAEATLPAPQGVVINYGSVPASSKDDTVTFEAVENAVSYKVYVYQDGDTEGKVTQGTDTTIELAAPLDAGEYLVAVVAVGDGVSSKASAPVAYTVEEEVKEKLGQVSGIAMDFSQVDADNALYPVISFSPVENAGRYLVDVYAANKDGEKQLTNLGYTTRFTVPAAQAGGYMMDSTNYASLIPGYYVVAVSAYSNNSNYANGDPIEALIAWTNVDAIQPKVKAEEPENGGISVALENYEDYNAGISLDVAIYADTACTELIKQQKLTYTTSESFGNVTHNNSAAFEVKDAEQAKDNDLVVGKEYYAVMSFDPEIYIGKYASDPVAFTCGKAGDGKKSAGGGMGGPGGGMAGFEVVPTEASFEEGAETFAWQIGEHQLFHTTAKLVDAADGDVYTYKLEKGDPNAPFDVPMELHLKDDGTTLLTVEGAGPVASTRKNGTWSADGGIITLNWD